METRPPTSKHKALTSLMRVKFSLLSPFLTCRHKMVDLPDSPSSPATSAAIPTTTNRAYDLMKQGGGRESEYEYEMVPASSSPASKPLEVYVIPSQPLPAKEKEEGVYYSIPRDQ